MNTADDRHRAMVLRLKKSPFEIMSDLTADKVDMVHMAIGLSEEVGECQSLIKKHVFNGHPLNRAELKKELGDTAFYFQGLALAAGFTLAELLDGNTDGG